MHGGKERLDNTEVQRLIKEALARPGGVRQRRPKCDLDHVLNHGIPWDRTREALENGTVMRAEQTDWGEWRYIIEWRYQGTGPLRFGARPMETHRVVCLIRVEKGEVWVITSYVLDART